MTRGRSGIHSQPSRLKYPTCRKRLRLGMGLLLGNPDLCLGVGKDPIHVRDMVAMGVGQEEIFELEAVLPNGRHETESVRPGIESHGLPGLEIPHEVGVHRHVPEVGIELRQTLDRLSHGTIGLLSQLHQSDSAQGQAGRQAQKAGFKRLPRTNAVQILQRHTGFDRKLGIAQPGGFLCLVENIHHRVFERNQDHVSTGRMKRPRPRKEEKIAGLPLPARSDHHSLGEEIMTNQASTSHPILEIRNLVRRFGTTPVLDDISLVVNPGEFFTLLGPSGCGKTTLLRLIAGLDQADSGCLKIDGKEASGTPAHSRPVHTVFQSYALFPHLNVRDNVAFGLRMKRVPAAEISARVDQALDWVQASALADRRPDQLSGGQKQRIALARAAVNEPRILLLDEPLAALDLKLRLQLQEELRQLQKRLAMTFIYVTHDQDEAFALSDRVALLNHGRLAQVGTPQELYERPASAFVAQFFGGCNLIPARRTGPNTAATSLGPLRITSEPVLGTAEAEFQLGIRPEEIRFLTHGVERENSVQATVLESRFLGAETRWRLEAGGLELKVVTHGRASDHERQPGTQVRAELPAGSLRCLPTTLLVHQKNKCSKSDDLRPRAHLPNSSAP